MTITYRPADVSDAEAIDGIFRQSFIDTFAHLYRP
ncbi:MAG: GNAT family N-acetyltransferase, partial [Sphingomonas sp.]|nr:GNAT family N-acetyltransferase [Sphingomonas sp.]